MGLSDRAKQAFHPFVFQGIRIKSILYLFIISHKLLKILTITMPTLVLGMLVAEDGKGNKVGFAYYKVKKREKGFVVANLGIVIKDGAKEKGIGSRLLASLLEQAKKDGIDKMQFTVLADNEAAIGLYKKFGAVLIGETDPDYWEGQPLKNLLMEIDLASC